MSFIIQDSIAIDLSENSNITSLIDWIQERLESVQLMFMDPVILSRVQIVDSSFCLKVSKNKQLLIARDTLSYTLAHIFNEVNGFSDNYNKCLLLMLINTKNIMALHLSKYYNDADYPYNSLLILENIECKINNKIECENPYTSFFEKNHMDDFKVIAIHRDKLALEFCENKSHINTSSFFLHIKESSHNGMDSMIRWEILNHNDEYNDGQCNGQDKKKLDYRCLYEHYEKCFSKYGDTFKGVDWNSFESTQVRYQVMLDIIGAWKISQLILINNLNDLSNEQSIDYSILDIGCGCGHLYEYILKNNIKGLTYNGTDISKIFIDCCKSKYPEVNFFESNILENNSNSNKETYDFAIMNGIFTEKRHLSDNVMFNFLCKMIESSFSLVKKGIAFNIICPYVDWKSSSLFYLSYDKVIEFIRKNISKRIQIKHDYGMWEYTVYVFK